MNHRSLSPRLRRPLPADGRRFLAYALVGAPFLFFLPREASAEEGSVGLSLSLERTVGIAYASIRPTTSNTSYGVTSFTLAGAAVNPIALPRIGVDAILPFGLTLGGAIAYGVVSLSSNPDQGQGSTETGHAFLISPRVGYMFRLSPLLDLVPRAGITVANAGLTYANSQSCVFTGTVQSCTTTPGNSESLTLVAASLEVAAALRLTPAFNLLGGLAYDHVLSASGSSTRGSTGTSTDSQAGGKYLGFQVWFGLGGYVL